MSTCLVPRSSGLALSALIALTTTACVDSFDGAFIEIVFDPNVTIPAEPGQTPSGAQPPADTFYAIWAVQYEYASCDACPTGTTCDTASDTCLDDTTMEPAVADSYAFNVVNFEIKPLIRNASPCFIEHPERPYPGLHATKEVDRLALDLGISFDGNGKPILDGIPEGDQIDMLTAIARRDFLDPLQNDVHAVTSFSNALAPGRAGSSFQVATACVEDDPNVDPNLIPPPNCILDQSNARRAELCNQFWDENPDFYEGSDLVFTLPLNGKWRGAVSGANPKNEIGFLDGASFFVEPSLDKFDALLVQWQYKDINGDGAPDFPDTLPDSQRSSIGYHYMEGTPRQITRGVLDVPLSNRVFSVTGKASVVPNIGEDDVHF